MTSQPTHWLEYGDPIKGKQAVEATHRITYLTGPEESREDDRIEGVLSYDGLDIGWGENDEPEHVHDDGSLCLSALDDDKRDRVMAEFQPIDTAEALRRLVNQGLSAAAALDYHMVETRDWSQSDWATHRGISQQAVSENITAAKNQLEDTA